MVTLNPQNPNDKKTAHWAEAFGLFNKEIGRAAASLAHLVPEDSTLRNPIIGRMLGAIGPFIESQSDRISTPFLAAIVERFSVFTDEFASCLYGEDAPPPKATRLQVSDDWVHNFMHEAHSRVSKSEDPDAEFTKIQNEFKVRLKIAHELQNLMKEHQKNVSSCRTPAEHESLRKELKEMGQKIVSVATEVETKADAAAGKLAPHIRNLTDRIRARQERRREEDLCR